MCARCLRPVFRFRNEPLGAGLLARAEDYTFIDDAVLVVRFEEFALDQQRRFLIRRSGPGGD